MKLIVAKQTSLMKSLRLCASARNIIFQILVLLAFLSIATPFIISLTARSNFIIQEKPPLRVAVIGFTQKAANYNADSARMLETALGDSLKSDSRISLIERNMFQPALAAFGYDGSINLSREEARRIGAVVGCDFFITGKAEAVARSESKGDSHIEAIIGIIIVDGRSGDLAHFDFIEEKAATVDFALNKASNRLRSKASFYAEKVNAWRDTRETLKAKSLHEKEAAEFAEEIPSEGSPQSQGFKPPQFLSRVKPVYTAQAERADISATVEASVIFRANGEIGQIEITRWAGFGLDQSAIEAIRKLKFKPATRNGNAINVRATVQYNFRRVDG